MKAFRLIGTAGAVAAALALAGCDDGESDGQARAALPPPETCSTEFPATARLPQLKPGLVT